MSNDTCMYKCRMKQFSHTDMDGAGCIIVGKLLLSNVDFQICGYEKIDEKIMEFLTEESRREVNSYDILCITDITPSDETIEFLNESCYADCYYIIDHHATAEYKHNMNKSHIFVKSMNKDGMLNSGTNLFLHFLMWKFKFGIDKQQYYTLLLLVKNIRSYDTWYWKEVNDKDPYYLNEIFNHYGLFKFIQVMEAKCRENNFFLLDNDEFAIIKERIRKIDYMYDNTIFSLPYEDEFDNKFVIAILIDNISYIGNKYLEEHPEIDYIMLLNLNSNFISLRSIDKVDVGEIANKHGGGGHKNASGYKLTQDNMDMIFDRIEALI